MLLVILDIIISVIATLTIIQSVKESIKHNEYRYIIIGLINLIFIVRFYYLIDLWYDIN